MPDLMNTHEVAEYLRIKQRKVYDLVKARRIPCTRVTGKWLFPKALIDQWLDHGAEGVSSAVARPAPPPVIAGSHDPLLEWCLNQAGAGLAMLPGGSLDGLDRLAAGEAAVCGLHVRDEATGDYNVPLVCRRLVRHDLVVIEWAWREQGLVVASGNPLGLADIADLRRAKVACRQDEAGSQILLLHLLGEANIALDDLDVLDTPARSETELALHVLEGKADAGLAVAAVARQLKLDFVPLHRERYDLVMRRRDYFEAPFQSLLRITRSAAFAAHAADLSGYDCAGLGNIVYNARDWICRNHSR